MSAMKALNKMGFSSGDMQKLLDDGQAQLVLGAIALVVVVVLVLISNRPRRNVKTGRVVPSLPSWPFLKSSLALLPYWRRIHQLCLDYFAKYGETFSVSVAGGFTYLVVKDPKNVEHILSSHFENYVKGPDFHQRLGDLLGDGIFNNDGDQWKLHRKISARIFNVRNFRETMMPVFLRHCETLCDIINRKGREGEIDMHDMFHRFTLDSIGAIAFGENIGSMTRPASEVPFLRSYDEAQKIASDRFLIPYWRIFRYFWPREKEIKRHIQILDDYTYKIIKRKRAQGQDANQSKTDLLSQFLSRADLSGGDFTDKELRDIVMNFLVAGRDTTAQALSWTLYELTQHPEVVQKLEEEIESVSQEFSEEGVLTYDDLKKLTYTQAVIDEALRLHPSVPVDPKMALKDDVLPDGTPVRKGEVVLYSAIAMGHDPALWDRASEFTPERWLEGPRPNMFTYPVFQAGPRTCLGMAMATMEMKVVLFHLFSKFKFELVPGQEIVATQSLTHPMKNGLRVKASPRPRTSAISL